MMLEWATKKALTPHDSAQAWNLITQMVYGRHEVVEEAAVSFLHTHLCTLTPETLTWQGWRCITAYLAALSNWEVVIPEGSASYRVDFVARTRVSEVCEGGFVALPSPPLPSPPLPGDSRLCRLEMPISGEEMPAVVWTGPYLLPQFRPCRRATRTASPFSSRWCCAGSVA